MKKAVTLTLVILLTLSLLTACGGVGGNSNTPSGDNNTTTTPPASDNSGSAKPNNSSDQKGGLPPNTRIIKVGQTLEGEGITVTLDEVWVSTHTGVAGKLPEGHVFLFPHFTITNKNESDISKSEGIDFATGGGAVIGGVVEIGDNAAYIGDEEYRRSINALMAYDGPRQQMDVTVKYGETAEVMNAFIVPEEWETVTFLFNHMMSRRLIPLINLTFEVKSK